MSGEPNGGGADMPKEAEGRTGPVAPIRPPAPESNPDARSKGPDASSAGNRAETEILARIDHRTEPSSAPSPARGALLETRSSRIPLGPYAGKPISEVAIIDPAYLLDWIREGIGTAEIRAEAARALALRQPEPSPAKRGWRWLAAGAATLFALALIQVGTDALAGTASPGNRELPQVESLGEGTGPATTGRDISKAGGAALTEPLTNTFGHGPEDALPASPAGQSAAASHAAAAGAGIDYEAPCGARVPGAIPAASAGDFLDSFQAVEFEVVRGKDTGKVTFLNSRDPYQGHFYVAIFPGDYDRFGGAPARDFKNRCIVVQGLIETYRGSPQIVLRDAGDLRVVERVEGGGP